MAKLLTDVEKSEKRKILLDHSINILAEEGIDGLSMRSLAKEANISRTTPYLYFKDKTDLLNALRANIVNELAVEIQTSLATTRDYLTQMKLIGDVYFNFGIERPGKYRLLFLPECVVAQNSQELQQALDAYQTIVLLPLENAHKKGLLRIPPERLNRVLWAAIHGALSLFHSGMLDEGDFLPQLQADLANVLALGFIQKDQ